VTVLFVSVERLWGDIPPAKKIFGLTCKMGRTLNDEDEKRQLRWGE